MSKTHARFSPSKLQAKETCSRFDYKEDEDGQENEFAAEGTLMHEALETGNLSKLDPEQQEQVVKVHAYFDSLLTGIDPKRVRRLSEVKVTLPDRTFGTADIVILVADEDNATAGYAIVGDAKFGMKPVPPAHDNVQLMCYCGALLFGTTETPLFFTPREVYGHMVSPRINDASTTVFTMADKDRILARIDKILANAANPFHAPTPDVSQCPNCQWQATCPALKGLAVATGTELTTRKFLPSVFDLQQIDTAAPEDKAKVYALAQLLEGWAEQAKKAVTKAVLEKGETVPGYEVRSRAGSAKITDVREAVSLLSTMLSKEEVLDAATLSITKLVDIVALGQGLTKAEAKSSIEASLETVIERNPDIRYLQRKRGTSEEDILNSASKLQLGISVPSPES